MRNRGEKCGLESRSLTIDWSVWKPVLVMAWASLSLAMFPQDTTQRSSGLHFERDVLPILKSHCTLCHAGSAAPEGLDLQSADSLWKGSSHGPVVVRGASEDSYLYHKISTRVMPPPSLGMPLTDQQIEIIRGWIDSGALTVADERNASAGDRLGAKIVEIDLKDRQFWSFQRPRRPTVPKIKHRGRVRTPIDAFVLDKLEKKGLSFSADASPQALMRRVYLDLIGLPPSLEEMRSFLSDRRPDAYDQLLERLLSSPHYGERWGRHWLDVAGYTDEAEEMWRYRDYVTSSFNEDKPYDQFLTEQLAGDELVAWRTESKYNQETVEKLIATGYLRTVKDTTDAPEANVARERYNVLFQVVDLFTSGVLGLTAGCARCHSHKYDPIPQEDYYRLAAIFAGAYNPEEWKTPKERYLPAISKREQKEIAQHNAAIDGRLEELTRERAELRRSYQQGLFESKMNEFSVPELLQSDIRSAFDSPTPGRTIRGFLYEKFKEVLEVSAEEVDRALKGADKVRNSELWEQIKVLESQRRSFAKVRALWESNVETPVIRLFHRGNIETPGPVVEPGFFAVLSSPSQSALVLPVGTVGKSSGNRLALARWLTSIEHPLTARVMVNRVWMHHFGDGIVATPENFGRTGSPPTHPELLDWLAVDFMENGWRIKRLHRLIMTSTVYRQSSRRLGEGRQDDPSNALLWRMNLRRLEAEALRDSLLAVSGKLDRSVGGPPTQLDETEDGLVVISEEGRNATSRWRRSLYLEARRSDSLPFLDLFDLPIMSLNCTRRLNSTTPLQSLSMLNSEFVTERAKDFVLQVEKQVGVDAKVGQQIEMIFLLALARKPTEEEGELCRGHLQRQIQRYRGVAFSATKAAREALTSVCHMILASNEFLYVE